MNLEIYPLRILCQVLKDGSFSAAARALRITQPAVSLQIGKLEREIGARLFERVGHDIVATDEARRLQKLANSLIDQLEEYGETLREHKSAPRGLVRYAMPESCQWTPHYRDIMAQLGRLPEMRFEIDILHSEAIAQGLLEARYDFGFITGERISTGLRFEKYCDETYSAVARDKRDLEAFRQKDLAGLRLVAFPGWEIFFTAWARAHGIKGSWRTRMPEPAARIGTLAGAIHAVQEGAGAAVIPTHCVSEELKSGLLHEAKLSRGVVASHAIYIARRVGDTPVRRVELVISMLKEAKARAG